MRNDSAELIVFVVLLVAAALFIGLGVPLAKSLVPPNGLYGFRIQDTFENAAVWYPVNRVTGIWCIAIGCVTAVAAVWSHLAGWPFPLGAMIASGILFVGTIAMTFHGLIVCHRVKKFLNQGSRAE